MDTVRRISTRTDLLQVARYLQVRPDWHEPDEQEVTAEVQGKSFDNAGFWGTAEQARLEAQGSGDIVEVYVTLTQDGKAVAEINLATLFAFATGHEG